MTGEIKHFQSEIEQRLRRQACLPHDRPQPCAASGTERPCEFDSERMNWLTFCFGRSRVGHTYACIVAQGRPSHGGSHGRQISSTPSARQRRRAGDSPPSRSCVRAVAMGTRGEQSRHDVHGTARPIACTRRHRHWRTAIHVWRSGAKRQISGIVFGGGLALFATQFLAWLF